LIARTRQRTVPTPGITFIRYVSGITFIGYTPGITFIGYLHNPLENQII
jgi:hypothetical protein